MIQKESPKFSKKNYTLWCGRMKLYLITLGDQYQNNVSTEYNEPTGVLTTDQIKEKQDNITSMEVIASTLSDNEYAKIQDPKNNL